MATKIKKFIQKIIDNLWYFLPAGIYMIMKIAEAFATNDTYPSWIIDYFIIIFPIAYFIFDYLIDEKEVQIKMLEEPTQKPIDESEDAAEEEVKEPVKEEAEAPVEEAKEEVAEEPKEKFDPLFGKSKGLGF